MANNTTGNPWSLDTAGVIATFPVYVKSLVWQDFTANGTDTLTILDNAGRTIINSKTNTTGDVMDFGDFRWVEGFHITLISSGIVTVVVHK